MFSPMDESTTHDYAVKIYHTIYPLNIEISAHKLRYTLQIRDDKKYAILVLKQDTMRHIQCDKRNLVFSQY